MGRAKNNISAVNGFDDVFGSRRGPSRKLAGILLTGSPAQVRKEMQHIASEVQEGKLQRAFTALQSLDAQSERLLVLVSNMVADHLISEGERREAKTVRRKVREGAGITRVDNTFVYAGDYGQHHLLDVDNTKRGNYTLCCGEKLEGPPQTRFHNQWAKSSWRCEDCAYKLEDMKKSSPEHYNLITEDMLSDDIAPKIVEDGRRYYVQQKLVDHFGNGNSSVSDTEQRTWARESYWHGVAEVVARNMRQDPYKTLNRLYGAAPSEHLVKLDNAMTARGETDLDKIRQVQALLLPQKDLARLLVEFAQEYEAALSSTPAGDALSTIGRHSVRSVRLIQQRASLLELVHG